MTTDDSVQRHAQAIALAGRSLPAPEQWGVA